MWLQTVNSQLDAARSPPARLERKMASKRRTWSPAKAAAKYPQATKATNAMSAESTNAHAGCSRPSPSVNIITSLMKLASAGRSADRAGRLGSRAVGHHSRGWPHELARDFLPR